MNVQYVYRATVVSVYDGDTIRVHVDLGLGVHNRGTDGKGLPIRLYGIDTPEIRGDEREAGLLARDFVRERILGKQIVIQTILDKTGKYGRYLANVWYDNSDGVQKWLNNELLEAGHATIYEPT